MHELAAWWAAHPEAALAGMPLGQDGQPSTCGISGPRRPPRTFGTPNCAVSSVSVGWWRSGAANWKTPVDIFNSDMKPRVFPVPRAAGSLLKILIMNTSEQRAAQGPGRSCCGHPGIFFGVFCAFAVPFGYKISDSDLGYFVFLQQMSGFADQIFDYFAILLQMSGFADRVFPCFAIFLQL